MDDLDILLARSYNKDMSGLVCQGEVEDWLVSQITQLIDGRRLSHSLGVRDSCEYLAVKYGADVQKARLAGLVHDCAKGLDDHQLVQQATLYGLDISYWQDYDLSLLHGPVAAALARERLGITDAEILHAVAVHTTGCTDMNLLDLVLFVADYIEPGRTFEGVDRIRRAAEQSLELAALEGFATTIEHLLRTNRLIHPLTIHARNSLLMRSLAPKVLADEE